MESAFLETVIYHRDRVQSHETEILIFQFLLFNRFILTHVPIHDQGTQFMHV